jgi:hypothetical protein
MLLRKKTSEEMRARSLLTEVDDVFDSIDLNLRPIGPSCLIR